MTPHWKHTITPTKIIDRVFKAINASLQRKSIKVSFHLNCEGDNIKYCTLKTYNYPFED